MQPNYIVTYNITKNGEKTYKRSQEKIRQTAERIAKKEITTINTKENPIAKVMRNNFTSKYRNADKHFNISDDCTHCGLCSKVCPVENIVMENGVPTFQHHCEQCLACVHACPQRALNFKKRTQKRNRYRHPDISVKDLIEQKTKK